MWTRIFAFVVSIAVAAVVYLCVPFSREANTGRERADAATTRNRDHQTVIHELRIQSRTDSEQQHAATRSVKGKTADPAVDKVVEPAEPTRRSEQRRVSLDSPEGRQAQLKKHFEKEYAPIFARLDLTTEQQGEVVELLVSAAMTSAPVGEFEQYDLAPENRIPV